MCYLHIFWKIDLFYLFKLTKTNCFFANFFLFFFSVLRKTQYTTERESFIYSSKLVIHQFKNLKISISVVNFYFLNFIYSSNVYL